MIEISNKNPNEISATSIGVLSINFEGISKQDFQLSVCALSNPQIYSVSIMPTSSINSIDNFIVSSTIKLSDALQKCGFRQENYPNSNFFIGKYILPQKSTHTDLVFYAQGVFIDYGYKTRVICIHNPNELL